MSFKTTLLSEEKENVIERKEKSSKEKIFGKFNKAFLSGAIEEEFQESYEISGEKYYKTAIRVTRLSGNQDVIPLVVSERLIPDKGHNYVGSLVEVSGQFRSRDEKKNGERIRLKLFFLVKEFKVYENKDEMEKPENSNLIYLEGCLCKPPVYRKTPLEREITDLFLVVNRSFYGKTDYVPCITWGMLARQASAFKIGDRIKLYGRIQSREYFKRMPETLVLENGELRTAYEVSIMWLKKVDELVGDE